MNKLYILAMLSVFGVWGVISLVLSAFLWAVSHWFFTAGKKELDIATRIVSFGLLVSIFIISGLKAGIISILIILLASLLGVLTARIFVKKGSL